LRANTEGGVWLVCGPEQARGISGPGEAGFVISGAVCRVSGGAARVILAVPASRASQLGGISGSRAQITAFAKTLIGSHYLHGSGVPSQSVLELA
jgi:hypothetical protein